MKHIIILGLTVFVYVTVLCLILYKNVSIALNETVGISVLLENKMKRQTTADSTPSTATTIVDETVTFRITGLTGTGRTTESLDQTLVMYEATYYRLLQWNPLTVIRGCTSTLDLPVRNIFINETATPNCLNNASCLYFLERLLIYSTNDLWFNFLIGGNGRIYEGQALICPVESFGLKSIFVTLTGDSGSINFQQYSALKLLITANYRFENIEPEYRLVLTRCTLPGNDPLYTNLSETFLNHFRSSCSYTKQ